MSNPTDIHSIRPYDGNGAPSPTPENTETTRPSLRPRRKRYRRDQYYQVATAKATVSEIVALLLRRADATFDLAPYLAGLDPYQRTQVATAVTAALEHLLDGSKLCDIAALRDACADAGITLADYRRAVRLLGGCLWELDVPEPIYRHITQQLRGWESMILHPLTGSTTDRP